MKSDKPTLAFEVVPSVHYDDLSRKWYAACTLFVHGRQQQRAVYTEVSFENMRRAKQFARFCAGKMEWDLKRKMLERMTQAGQGLLKHG